MKQKVLKVKRRMDSKVKEILFGLPVKGEKVREPKFRTVYPAGRGPGREVSFIEVVDWCKEIGASRLSDKTIVHIN